MKLNPFKQEWSDCGKLFSMVRVVLLSLSVTSIVSRPPEAQKKQLFWIWKNKRSCYYSNQRTLWKKLSFNTSQSLRFTPPSFPFVHQCRLPLDRNDDGDLTVPEGVGQPEHFSLHLYFAGAGRLAPGQSLWKGCRNSYWATRLLDSLTFLYPP